MPPTFSRAQVIREQKIKVKTGSRKNKVFSDVTCYGKNSVVYYINSFVVNKQKLNDIILLFLDKRGKLTKRVVAKEAEWKGSHWEFKEVTDYETNEKGSMLGEPRIYATKVYPEVTETPEDFVNASSEKSLLRYKELKEYIQRKKSNKLKTYSEEVELQNKLSSPWQSLVMMFIAIPLLMRTASLKIIALNVLFCLSLVFCFHVVSAVCRGTGIPDRHMIPLS